MYKIIRFYSDNRDNKTIETNLTLEEAREHCHDDETSSDTATGENSNIPGNWFDGYEEQ